MNSGGDIHDPLVRRYLLTDELHIPPSMQDDCSAVELDELLVLHGRVKHLRAAKEARESR